MYNIYEHMCFLVCCTVMQCMHVYVSMHVCLDQVVNHRHVF